jgi:hypothetical protein
MTDVLEVVGLVSLITAGFLITLWLGFLVLGAGCLFVARAQVRKR